MPDNLTKVQRSYCMSRVKGTDTSLERKVRSALHARGYRFRKHLSSLPGRPDIVFTKQEVAVFIDGDFWHGWRFPSWRDTLRPFWQKKIEQTRQRDQRNFRQLRSMGWEVIRIWEHDLKRDFDKAIDRVCSAVQSRANNGGRS